MELLLFLGVLPTLGGVAGWLIWKRWAPPTELPIYGAAIGFVGVIVVVTQVMIALK
jgi:hypothetical protein